MRILLVATRDPSGPPTGRSTSLGTLITSLLELGHQVELAVLSHSISDAGRWPAAVTVHRLPPPPPLRWVLNVAWRATRLRFSLNECLYYSPSLAARVRSIARERGCELVIADMIRTFELAKASGLPMILDLDDLLSARYGRMASGGLRSDGLFGYFPVPPVLGSAASRLAGSLLKIEAYLQRRREEVAAGEVPVVCLVSPVEAELLAGRVGRKIWVAPMAVDVTQARQPGGAPPTRLRQAAFVGGLDYRANLDAVLWFRNEVLPAWRDLRLGQLELHLFGRCPDKLRPALHDPQIVIRGFVPDLFSELVSFPAFAAPMISGGGVKTKVVEAMTLGLPVVSTSSGVEGIDVEDSDGCLIADDAGDFARALARLFDDPEMAARLAARGQTIALRDFAPAGRARRWSEMIDQAMVGEAFIVW